MQANRFNPKAAGTDFLRVFLQLSISPLYSVSCEKKNHRIYPTIFDDFADESPYARESHRRWLPKDYRFLRA